MMNAIWPIFIIISIFYGISVGNIKDLSEAIFNSSGDAIKLILTLFGTICLWNGIMRIALNTKIVDRIVKILNPLINYLFPNIKKDKKIKKEVSMNIVANVLGVGNAATPLGLKAMDSMQKENKQKDRLTDDMATFIILNTASIQVIPNTVIAVRTSLGSVSPTKVIFAIWISTICAAIVGILVTKICIKLRL